MRARGGISFGEQEEAFIGEQEEAFHYASKRRHSLGEQEEAFH